MLARTKYCEEKRKKNKNKKMGAKDKRRGKSENLQCEFPKIPSNFSLSSSLLSPSLLSLPFPLDQTPSFPLPYLVTRAPLVVYGASEAHRSESP